MNLKKYQPLLETILFSSIIYLAQKFVFYLVGMNNPKLQELLFPIEGVYGFFLCCSLILLFILIKVKEKNIDNVGYTFLLVTGIKLTLSYVFLSLILNSGTSNIKYDKINFSFIFLIFIALETTVTIRMLNGNK
jgi:hypothetical protein